MDCGNSYAGSSRKCFKFSAEFLDVRYTLLHFVAVACLVEEGDPDGKGKDDR